MAHLHLLSPRTGGRSAVLAAAVAMGATTWMAPAARADAATSLRAEVDAAREGCTPLQSDSALDGVAARANAETQSYKEHTARFIPFEDPMPVLRELGYSAGKAKLIAGYGDNADEAVHGILVHGWEAIPDCTYTRYGLNTTEGNGYVLTAVVLTGN